MKPTLRFISFKFSVASIFALISQGFFYHLRIFHSEFALPIAAMNFSWTLPGFAILQICMCIGLGSRDSHRSPTRMFALQRYRFIFHVAALRILTCFRQLPLLPRCRISIPTQTWARAPPAGTAVQDSDADERAGCGRVGRHLLGRPRRRKRTQRRRRTRCPPGLGRGWRRRRRKVAAAARW